LRRHGHASSGREFVSRRRYGDYLEDKLIETSLRAAQHDIAFSANGGTRVTDVMDGGDAFLVALDDGRSVGCDAVVLATGHASPPDILARWLPRGHARWIRDPWAAPGVGPGGIGRDDRVLMIGSGLTMIDKLLELEACGHTGPVHALSRRGLLPRAHRRRPETLPADVQRALSDGLARAGSLRAMLRVTRRAIAAAEHRGTSWRPVIDALRALAPSLWSRLSPADRRRLLRRLRPYSDVHRHRTAPSIGAVIEARLAAGRLEVRAGRVCGAEVRERGIVVEQRLRGATAPRREHYDWIVNCTGHDRPGAGRALEERLPSRGLPLPGLDGLGWIAAPGGSPERRDGSPPRAGAGPPAARSSSARGSRGDRRCGVPARSALGGGRPGFRPAVRQAQGGVEHGVDRHVAQAAEMPERAFAREAGAALEREVEDLAPVAERRRVGRGAGAVEPDDRRAGRGRDVQQPRIVADRDVDP